MKEQLHIFFEWARRHISSVAFVCGFVWDTFTLTRIDLVYENVVFISYLIIAFVGILLVHGAEAGRWSFLKLQTYKVWLPALVQFPLGGLFSGFVIFYTKSASFVTSWPFLLFLLILFVGNEFFRRRYERLVFQISVFYFALLSYFILITPIILGTIGTSTFVLASIASLFAIALLLQIVMRLFDELYRRSMRAVWMAIVGVFIGFHILYFTNTIPPVPLTLQDIGVYHSVTRIENDYLVIYEEPQWFEFWRSTHRIYHRAKHEAAYCFSAIYAPTDLRTKVFHSWQRKTEDGVWIREDLIGYPLVGGREEGYRGYTIKTVLSPGEWKCAVELENRQVIGEVYFRVEEGGEQLHLMRDTL